MRLAYLVRDAIPAITVFIYMLRNKIYYDLKPFLPERWRTSVRRRLVARQRAKARDTWPIMPGSERPPDGWPGWPEGKKFALVLTHDIEGKAGLERCRPLMELEMDLGFRSSFNFIPEGDYRVPATLREELGQAGFEVGVHDLKHDGHLFRSFRKFRERAVRINRYLRDWNAVGFRSGFMLHNLDWLHHLEIEYDLSTFDTDPFEPQPEGRHTIFPFWVSRPPFLKSQLLVASEPDEDGPTLTCRDGYVELPYTLPQDSTLFLLLREKTADLWIQKLDWIAANGGMVLLDTHPDYMDFHETSGQREGYPVRLYSELLEYIRSKYAGKYWHVLPREMAQYALQTASTSGGSGIEKACSPATSHQFPLPADGVDQRLDWPLAHPDDDVIGSRA
jgi:hypothetical protein